MSRFPSLSTDQLAALVELARHGSLRAAAKELHISEQGVRNRLLALEGRLGVSLYRKSRGMRRATQLTAEGRRFLPHAIALLERVREMCELFDDAPASREVNVVASQYLITYVLIDAVRKFHAAYPNLRVRLRARTEREIEAALRDDPDVSVGVAAPYEPSPERQYMHLFSMTWNLVTPRGHRLGKRGRVSLSELESEGLILYESGSTGRQHVIDSFHLAGVTPRVEMEATNTDVIIRMVEAGLGLSIVPLLPSGAVTRGHRLDVCSLADPIRPIDSGILMRRGEPLPEACRTFIDFVRVAVAHETVSPSGKRKGSRKGSRKGER